MKSSLRRLTLGSLARISFFLSAAVLVAGSSLASPPDVLDAFGRPILVFGDDGSMEPQHLPSQEQHGADGHAGGLFRPYQTYALSSGAVAVAIGEVTGDGRADVVAIEPTSNLVHVLAQTPSGTLAAPETYVAPITYSSTFGGSVAIADMNQDGRRDVVVTLDGAVGVMLQTATGHLEAYRAFPTVHNSFSNVFKLTAGDFNHDGLADVASIDWGTQSQDVDLFLQNPVTLLGSPTVYQTIHGGYDDLDHGDVNGDGRDDLIVMSGQAYVTPNFGVLAQGTQGGLLAAVYYDLGGDVLARSVGVGDVNGDGRNDVVLSYGGNGPSAHIAVFPQTSSGLLGQAMPLPSLDIPGTTVVTDVNLDGRDDVLTLHNGWLALGVYLQDGNGNLGGEITFPIPYSSWYNAHGMAVGDLDGDGRPDVAIADPYLGVVVLYQGSPMSGVVAHAGSDVIAECTSLEQRGSVQLDGRASEGEGLTFFWSAPGVQFDDPTSPTPTGEFPLGVTEVVLEVSNASGSDQDEVLVTVRDSRPPTIVLEVQPSMLWPPSRQLVPVHVSATTTDGCDPNPIVRLVSIECSESGPDGACTADDIVDAFYGDPDFDFLLRAERAGDGSGRAYLITYEASDAPGNVARQMARVVVPHSVGRASLSAGTPPRLTIFGGPAYTVSSVDPRSIVVGAWEEDLFRAAAGEASETDLDHDGLPDRTWWLESIAIAETSNPTLYARWQAGDAGWATALLNDTPLAVGSDPTRFAIRPLANPSRGRVRLQFELPGDGQTRLRMFDLAGRCMATLVDTRLSAGPHEAVFEPAMGEAAQVVYYRLEWNDRRIDGRTVWMR